MSNLNQKIATLSPAKRALLEAHLLKKATAAHHAEVGSLSHKLPELSFAQQSMWFLDRLEPNSSFYTIPQAMRICGALDVEALRKSLEMVVARHEVLRTQIVAEDGLPQPRVIAAPALILPIIHISNDEHSKIDQFIDDEAKRPFDLGNDLMLRASLLRLSECEHILLLTVHHIASDLWSFSVLYRELAALYEAHHRNTSAQLPALQFQYSDFARAQKKILQSENSHAQIAFWKKQLSGELTELKIPTDHTRPVAQKFRGARRHLRLSAELSHRLKTLNQNEGVTLFVTLLSAFQVLLHRYSGQDDIIIGSPMGGRNRFESENLIGYFLNTLALRTDLSGDPTFRELLRRSREVVLSAFSNSEIPFEKLVDELRIPRHGDKNPVFQTIFQFQAGGVPVLELQNTQIELLPSETGTSKMDLIFTLAESNEGLIGNLEYNTELYEVETVERMIGQYGRLLEAVVADPGERISRLNLLSQAERQTLLIDWNQTSTSYPRDRSIPQLFVEQVEKTPDAIALVFDGEQLTYRQLDQRADQLAQLLRESGVKGDSPVGICLERSFELIVGLLAILKAGGAYVPLDVHLPEERLRSMLEDTAVALIITDQEFSFSNARKIHPKDFPESGGPRFEVQSSADSLAYVLFTSGSTGKPKGVAVPHRAVVRLVKETNFMSFDPGDVFLQFAPVSFDASTLEIWGALLNGAKLVIHPPHLPSLEELGRTLRENKISTLWLTAGLFHQMVEHQIESLRGVKQLLAGGDVLSVAQVKKVLAQLDGQLINGYGPTENTTFTCCYAVPKDWNGRSVPIGKPIANTQVYILDQYLEPVPTGVPGELFIGGDGLARGYLNAPSLTAQKFIPHPFQPGERLYKTGDQVRWLADGTIEFLGRLDHQIKLRGFRIEPAEIEHALNQHHAIHESLVVLRQENDDQQLVAYFVSKHNPPPTPAELRLVLKDKLPDYMVPAHLLHLTEFPLTLNGKLNRRALPIPEDSLSTPKENLVSPRNPTEQKLFEIWSEVLGRNGFGIHENFFQLGGHSLLATRVASRISQHFKIQFSLRQIFEFPTISGLAGSLEKSPATQPEQPPLVRRGSRVQTASGTSQPVILSRDSQIKNSTNSLQTHANVY